METHETESPAVQNGSIPDPKNLLEFCRQPRTRKEIIEYLAISSAQYALRRYLDPLVESGMICMTVPEKPKSPRQKYVTASKK